MPERHISTFEKGMARDVSLLGQPNGTYRRSINGRLIFNEDGTFSWENMKGTKFSFKIKDGYRIIGWTSLSDKIIVFSTDNDNGEIGFVTVDENGLAGSSGGYKVLFNDANDPNGDLLNFTTTKQIEARANKESDKLERVYWTDNFNPLRSFSLESDGTTITKSVHSMNVVPEMRMGLIKFVKTTGGTLPTGVYQYSYRLVTSDGFKTAFYPITRRLFLTADSVNPSNWTLYEMENSGQTSSKGITIEISGIDQRYKTIEVAYAYSEAETVPPSDSSVFSITDITSDKMEFTHRQNKGEPVSNDDLKATFISIEKAKTIQIKDKRLWAGNVSETDVDIEADLTNLSFSPFTKMMHSDGTKVASGTPFTHQNPRNDTLTKDLYTGKTESYQLVDDYTGYKGMQFENIFAGYQRGDTYRLGIVFFDKRGNPSFVQHLADVTMPEIHEDLNSNNMNTGSTSFSWESLSKTFSGVAPEADYRLSTDAPATAAQTTSPGGVGKYMLKILGLKINGIDISSIRNQISGFAVVRAKRDNPRIIQQGLLLQSVVSGGDTGDDPPAGFPKGKVRVRPLPATVTRFNSSEEIVDGANIGPFKIGVYDEDTNLAGNPTDKYMVQPGIFTFHPADYMIDGVSPLLNEATDKIKVLQSFEYDSDYSQSGVNGIRLGTGTHVYTKSYKSSFEPLYTTPTSGSQRGYGVEFPMEEIITPGLGSFAAWSNGPTDTIFQNAHETVADLPTPIPGAPFKAFGHRNYFAVGCNGLNNVVTRSATSAFVLANYVRPNIIPYGGVNETSLAQTIYISTGTFIPVDSTTPDILNGVEVWGGDTYVDYFDFTRLVPRIEGDQVTTDDYAVSHIHPVESKYNFALRKGVTFAGEGTRPSEIRYGLTSDTFDLGSGIFFEVSSSDEVVDTHDLNSVLLHEENNVLYSPKPADFIAINTLPTRWRYSEIKIDGEPEDKYRTFLANSFFDVDGIYGEITSSSVLFWYLYSFQEEAFGRLRINERNVIQDTQANNIIVGSGGALTGIDYISQKTGNQHQFGMTNSGKAIYWIDARKRDFCRFAQDGLQILSDNRGMHQVINRAVRDVIDLDNPVDLGGISSVFDFGNNEAIFTIRRKLTSLSGTPLPPSDDFIFHSYAGQEIVGGTGFVNPVTGEVTTFDETVNVYYQGTTLLYNETNDAFTTFMSHMPPIWMNFAKFVFSNAFNVSSQNEVHVHDEGVRGEFFGTKKVSLLDVIVNPSPQYSKVFDIAHINSNREVKDILTNIEMTTELTTHNFNPSTDTRARNREELLKMPLRQKGKKDRVRGKHVKIKMQFTNDQDKLVRISNLETLFRLSKKV